MSDILALKYRPNDWKYVVGQDKFVRSLRSVIAKGTNRTFLLSGPSGVGKTTIARIAALEIGIDLDDPTQLTEINAAHYNTVDDMRALLQGINHKPMGKSKGRVIILDECHRVTSAAWPALLKPLEEPPPWLWWFLCTTDPEKVPVTVKTRCTKYQLSPVSANDLIGLLDDIAHLEKLELGASQKDHDAIISACAKAAQGSPRAALVNLGACIGAKSKDEALDLLQRVEAMPAAFDLAKMLAKGGANWGMVSELLASMKDDNPEGIRHVVRAYATTVILNSGNKPPIHLLAVLEAFGKPFPSTDGISPVLLACGNLLLGN